MTGRTDLLGDAMKKCRYCEKPIVLGREDKVFCDDRCRAAFHNQLRLPVGLSARQRAEVARYVQTLQKVAQAGV